MNKEKILIVGSGPSAFGFISGLSKEADAEITLIDNSQIQQPGNECKFKSEFTSGSRLIDDSVLDNPLISNHFGGFSNFWGGTYDDPTIDVIEKFSELDIDINKYLNYIDNLIPRFLFTNNPKKSGKVLNFDSILKPETIENIKSTDFCVKDSSIATNESCFNNFNENKICEFCGEIESFCRVDSIWNTKQFISNLIKKENIKYLSTTKLLSFEEKNNIVECKFLFENDIKFSNYDKLILASGPISTAEILINSKIVKKVSIKTTDLVQVPFFKLFKTSEKLHSFSDLFSSFKVLNLNTYQQYYFFSKTIFILSKNIFKLSRVLNFMPKSLLSLLGGMNIYLDREISSIIEMSLSNNKIITSYVDGDRKRRNQILRHLFKELIKSKIILLLPIKKLYLNGSSYHNGSQFPMDKLASNKTSDSLGRVSNLKNTHIVDSSVLPDVNTGPGVKLIVANSYRIGSNLYS